MGMNDAKEQLEVAIEEFGKLERENAELRRRAERAEADRDAALAVIERLQVAYEKWDGSDDGITPVLEAVEITVEQSPASALAKVKADTLRGAAEALPRLEGTQITRQQAAAYWLRDEADRIEKEGSLTLTPREVAQLETALDEPELQSCVDCKHGGPASEADCIEKQRKNL